jgi:short-subunit dehydrogenase involved in D-alanine esterification of teichoic acids
MTTTTTAASRATAALMEAILEEYPHLNVWIKQLGNGEEVVIVNEDYHIWTEEDWLRLSHSPQFRKDMRNR